MKEKNIFRLFFFKKKEEDYFLICNIRMLLLWFFLWIGKSYEITDEDHGILLESSSSPLMGSKPKFLRWRNKCISRNEGRSWSSRCQHSVMRSRTSLGHPWGVCSRIVGRPSLHMLEREDKTLASLWLSYGCSLAKVRISHKTVPNAQTSLLVVNLPWK